MTSQSLLSEWVAGLDDTETLGDAYLRMPGDDASAVPWYVRLLENPSSPVALPGAIDLFGHDCVHIVMGRGALPADEAFVLGVTMGTSKNLANWQQGLYKFAAGTLYRAPWRFSRSERLLFDMAVEFGRNREIAPLADVPWRQLRDQPLGGIRASLGIRKADLYAFYDMERAMWPDSVAARRLPKPGLGS